MNSLKSYSQHIPDTLLKEINIRLAEGLECKQLLHEKNIQLKSKDSIINVLKDNVSSLQKSLAASQENVSIAKNREAAAYIEIDRIEKSCEKSKKDIVRLRKGRNTWRWISIVETAILSGATYLLTL